MELTEKFKAFFEGVLKKHGDNVTIDFDYFNSITDPSLSLKIRSSQGEWFYGFGTVIISNSKGEIVERVQLFFNHSQYVVS
jgi:hypothetical protein